MAKIIDRLGNELVGDGQVTKDFVAVPPFYTGAAIKVVENNLRGRVYLKERLLLEGPKIEFSHLIGLDPRDKVALRSYSLDRVGAPVIKAV